MVDVEVNNGPNKDRRSNDKNSNAEEFTLSYKNCFKCSHLFNSRLQEKVIYFEMLPTSESKLAEMKAFLLEMDLRSAVFSQDYQGFINKMIAHEIELLEIKNAAKEKKLLEKEANIRANEVKNSTIQAGAPKLVVDCEEVELAAFFKKFVLESKNKKQDHIYKETNKVLANWICNSIKLKSGHVINYNTIVNGLSRIDYIDPNDEKGKN